MAIKLFRSTTSGSTPSSLADGQLALNTADEVLFYKNSIGTIVSFPLKAVVAALTAVRSVATGGTGASVAGGAAVDNISGFTGTGFLLRTAAATYGFVAQAALALSSRKIATAGALTGGGDLTADRTLDVAANGVDNSRLAPMAAGTVKANTGAALANAADITFAALKSALAIAAADVAGLGTAATRNVGTAAGTVAAGDDARFSATVSFPISGTAAKSADYTIGSTPGDLGKLFDLTGSIALTLPAASGGTASAPLYYHYRKRDGSGRATLVPAGADTIEGVNTPAAIYQERGTIVSFGPGWIFPPGGRERMVYVTPPNTAFAGVTGVAMLTGFDADVASVEIALDNVSTSATSAQINAQLYQSGAYVTSGYSGYGFYFTASGSSNSLFLSGSAAIQVGGIVGNASSGPLSGRVTLENVRSTAAQGASVRVESGVAGGRATDSEIYNMRAVSGRAVAVDGLKIGPASGTMSGTYSLRITRR